MSSRLALRVASRFLDIRLAKLYSMPRDFYLPEDYRSKPSIKPPGTDLEIWTWYSPEANRGKGKFYGIAFQGRAQKPLWYYSYPTKEGLWKQINESIASRKLSLEMKEQARQERREAVPEVKVGDIFYRSWGYDQTNVDFYEVTELVGSKSAIFRKIEKRVVKEELGTSYVVAVPGKFVSKEKPLKRLVQGKGRSLSFKVDNNASASLWDGKPKYETAFGWGH